MGKPLSDDLRSRLIAAVADGMSRRAAAERFAATIKARWVCEQAHQQLKQDLGLGAFEGRSWTGLHRHAVMACIAFAYLQHLRLKAVADREEKADEISATTTARPA